MTTNNRICLGRIMVFKPSWQVYHDLGKELAPHLSANYTFEEIGAELGVSRQRAYHLCMMALGKLAYGLKKNLQPAGAKRVQN